MLLVLKLLHCAPFAECVHRQHLLWLAPVSLQADGTNLYNEKKYVERKIPFPERWQKPVTKGNYITFSSSWTISLLLDTTWNSPIQTLQQSRPSERGVWIVRWFALCHWLADPIDSILSSSSPSPGASFPAGSDVAHPAPEKIDDSAVDLRPYTVGPSIYYSALQYVNIFMLTLYLYFHRSDFTFKCWIINHLPQ